MLRLTRPLVAMLCLIGCSTAGAATTCSATYATRNDWATGFVADVVLTNRGAATVSNWSVRWDYGKAVALTSAPWGAKVAISGGVVTSTDDGSRPSIAPGASVSFAMSLSYSGTKPVPGPITVNGVNCLVTAVNANLYSDPNSSAAVWARNNPSDGRAAAINANIASKAGARWFGGWNTDVRSDVANYVGAAAAAARTPVLVAYNIPLRDCGQHSAGGAASVTAYQDWIRAFANGIGQREAVVVLEPDALPQLDCLDAANRDARLQMIRYAVAQFNTLAPGAALYLDIGNSNWLAPAEAATRLYNAGVATARGFSLNVSNYRSDAESNAYGTAVSNALLSQRGWGKAFVVDTSRNGNGPLGAEWCDPAGRKIGAAPRVNPAGSMPEMTLWIKAPGEADGCAGAAGSFIPELAYKLIYGY